MIVIVTLAVIIVFLDVLVVNIEGETVCSLKKTLKRFLASDLNVFGK